MNCKQGDLALVVKSYAGNEGKIVTCREYLGYVLYIMPDGSKISAPSWRLDRTLTSYNGMTTDVAMDSALRPLRGDVHDDEVETMKEIEA